MLLPEQPYPVLKEPHPVVMENAADGGPSPQAIRTTEMANLMKRPKVLLVDNDENDRLLTRRSLETQNCEVVLATSVTDALRQIAAQRFDVLITDLHMPDPGDGFAVVTAMRHSQPNALTLVVSDFPDVQKAMNAILLQADEVLVKPFDATRLPRLMDKGKLTSLPSPRPAKEGAAAILDRDAAILIERWLERVKGVEALAALPISAEERSAYLPAMIKSITARLRGTRDIVAHGQSRYRQGYTAPLIVQESRLLQVSIFETIQRNLSTVDFTSVLPDIMIIADEVDSELKQAIGSFLAAQPEGASEASA
jgi:CheY-like chemotaxis protein